MDIQSFSYIIVGSGLFGSVMAERIANVLEQPVLLIEKRSHIGGNCYSATDATTGIEYHAYGTHVFHTGNPAVWSYINRFTGFNQYRHQVLSAHNNKLYQLPINLETINSFYNCNLKPFEVDAFLQSRIRLQRVSNPSNFEEKAISMIGPDLYEAFIKGYTQKQWQVDPRQLDSSIFMRLPVRKNYDENYFTDQWQGIPIDGYTAMFEKLIGHPLIKRLLNTDYFDIRDRLNPAATIIYSGPIDKFFDFKYGRLEWRSLRFEKEIMPYPDYQGTAVINYPDLSVPYTRIHEPVHLHPERTINNTQTIVFKEYSLKAPDADPYYPLLTAENLNRFQQYQQEATLQPNVLISGRLGDYKYYDMDKTIERALELFQNQVLPKTTAR